MSPGGGGATASVQRVRTEPEKARDATASRRAALFALQSRMRLVALSQRERDCGRLVCVEHDPEIRVRSEDGCRRASFNGLLRCGHVWTCAPCSQRIRARQAKRIADAFSWLGGQCAMVTLTLRHNAGMQLKPTIRALKGAWRRMRQRRDIRSIWKAVALAPVTACEVKWSPGNGWHPHLHVAFKIGRTLRPEERDLFFVRWQEAIVAELGAAARPNDARGIVWSQAFDADKEQDRALYVAKLGLALEVADPGLVKTGGGSASPFEIARAAADGDGQALARWREFYAATKGLHVLQLSPEAAEAARQAALERQADYLAEHANDEPPPPPDDFDVPTSAIRAMRSREHRWPTVFHCALVAAEQGGKDGFRRWLALHFPSHALDPPLRKTG